MSDRLFDIAIDEIPEELRDCFEEVRAECGAPWRRVVEKTTHFEGGSGKAGRTAAEMMASGKWQGINYGANIKLGPVVNVSTLGWQPTCAHGGDPVPCTVFDPFGGSFTTIQVAETLGRRGIGLELSEEYAFGLAKKRTAQMGLFVSRRGVPPSAQPESGVENSQADRRESVDFCDEQQIREGLDREPAPK